MTITNQLKAAALLKQSLKRDKIRLISVIMTSHACLQSISALMGLTGHPRLDYRNIE